MLFRSFIKAFIPEPSAPPSEDEPKDTSTLPPEPFPVAQIDFDSFLTAEAWFDALEAESSEKIGSQSALIAAAREVIEHLGGGTVGKDRFSVGGTILTPVFRGTRDGVHQIELKVDRPEMRNSGTVAFLRSFNSKSSNTVL